MFVLNLFVWAQASSTAIPFGTLIGIVALWLLIQVPLVYAGSWVGYHRSQPWEHPTRTSSIPRQIPAQAWYTKSIWTVLLAGLVPFAVIFIELLFVFRSLWQDKSGYYYVFGFLSVVSLVLIVTVVEVTIIATYVQLCAEVSARVFSLCLRLLTQGRIIIGGGSLSLLVEEVPFGSSSTAPGTISPNLIFKGSYRAYYFSATVSWRVRSTGY